MTETLGPGKTGSATEAWSPVCAYSIICSTRCCRRSISSGHRAMDARIRKSGGHPTPEMARASTRKAAAVKYPSSPWMQGDEMLRLTCLMLLAGASIAHAGEHYREVWNPPEARHTVHAPYIGHHKPTAHRLSAKRSTKTKLSRVATCVPTPTKREHVGRAAHVSAGPHVTNLPPLLAPAGNALRVDSHGARPEVVH